MAIRQTKADLIAALVERDETIEALRASIKELMADKAIAQVDEHIEQQFDESVIARVNRRTNQYGDVLNCKINPEYSGEITVRLLAKALGTTLAPRGKQRKDRNGHIWVDVYPVFNAPENSL